MTHSALHLPSGQSRMQSVNLNTASGSVVNSPRASTSISSPSVLRAPRPTQHRLSAHPPTQSERHIKRIQTDSNRNNFSQPSATQSAIPSSSNQNQNQQLLMNSLDIQECFNIRHHVHITDMPQTSIRHHVCNKI